MYPHHITTPHGVIITSSVELIITNISYSSKHAEQSKVPLRSPSTDGIIRILNLKVPAPAGFRVEQREHSGV